MSERNIVRIRPRRIPKKRAIRLLKGKIQSKLRSNPNYSPDWVKIDLNNMNLEISNLSRQECESLINSSIDEIYKKMGGFTINYDIFQDDETITKEQTEVATPDTVHTDIIDSKPLDVRPEFQYRLLLTSEAIQSLSQAPETCHGSLITFLQNLSEGTWQEWNMESHPNFSSSRGEESNRILYHYLLEGFGLIRWERVWSVDLFKMITYPTGTYNEGMATEAPFERHIIIYPVIEEINPHQSFVIQAEKFVPEKGLNKPEHMAPSSVGDQIEYSEELYVLTKTLIPDFVKGTQRGFPLHLSEEQATVISTEGEKLLNGEAGSGKTSVIIQWLVINHLRHNPLTITNQEVLKQLFVTFSPDLVDRAQSDYELMLPSKYQNHNTYFMTYRDLLLEVIKYAGLTSEFPPEKEMTFELFMEEFGEKRQAQKKIDYVLLWDEIRSVIKGGNNSEIGRYIDLEKYKELSEKRRQCKVPVELREHYYDEAQAYKNYLEKNGYWDAIDLAFSGLTSTKDSPITYDRIACDEIQDLAPKEISLLLKMLNKKELAHIFLTGDEAQVINPSGFTWDALKADLSREFDMYQIKDPARLLLNFRSSKEIVNLANSVLKVREEILPKDPIARLHQRAKVPYNISPVVLHTNPIETLKEDAGDPLKRLILVKTKEQKDKVLEELDQHSDNYSILTIEEAKGLEFDGILMYNFFIPRHELIEKNDWEYLFIPPKRKNLLEKISQGDKDKYGFTYEFNLLHVGLTRARRFLAIYDENPKYQLPNLSEDIENSVNVSNIEVFEKFWKTESPTPESLLDAGLNILLRDSKQAKKFFILAAFKFEKANQIIDAAEAYEKAEDYDKALNCFESAGDKSNELRIRAVLAEKEGDIESAGDFYVERGKYLIDEDNLKQARESLERATAFFVDNYPLKASSAIKSMVDTFSADKHVERARCYNRAAKYAQMAEELEHAVGLYEKSIESAKKVTDRFGLDEENNDFWIADRYMNIGDIYEQLSEFDNAAMNYQWSFSLFETLAMQVQGIKKTETLEKTVKALGLSIITYIKAEELVSAKRNHEKLVSILSSNLYIDKARHYLTNYSKQYMDLKEYGYYMDVVHDLAEILIEGKEHDEAIRILKNATRILIEAKRNQELPAAIEKLISSSESLNNPEGAAYGYQERAKLFESNKELSKAISDWHNAGRNYLRSNNRGLAEDSFEQGRKLYEKLPLPVDAGMYCLKDVVVGNYLITKDIPSSQIYQWIDKGTVYFVQDIEEAYQRFNDYQEQLQHEISEIKDKIDQTTNEGRKAELYERRNHHLRLLGWTDACLALSKAKLAKSGGDKKLLGESQIIYESAHKNFVESDDLNDIMAINESIRIYGIKVKKVD